MNTNNTEVTTNLEGYWDGQDWISYGVRGGKLFKRTVTYKSDVVVDGIDEPDEADLETDVTDWVTVEDEALALWRLGVTWTEFQKSVEANNAGYKSLWDHERHIKAAERAAKVAEAKRDKAVEALEAKLAKLKAS